MGTTIWGAPPPPTQPVQYAPCSILAVSYTHLDVYKRQALHRRQPQETAGHRAVDDPALDLIVEVAGDYLKLDVGVQDVYKRQAIPFALSPPLILPTLEQFVNFADALLLQPVIPPAYRRPVTAAVQMYLAQTL